MPAAHHCFPWTVRLEGWMAGELSNGRTWLPSGLIPLQAIAKVSHSGQDFLKLSVKLA